MRTWFRRRAYRFRRKGGDKDLLQTDNESETSGSRAARRIKSGGGLGGGVEVLHFGELSHWKKREEKRQLATTKREKKSKSETNNTCNV